jgi:hypothetical protein
MKKTIIITAVLALMCLGLTTALSCGDTITTDTTLTESLNCTAADGLIVGIDNLDIDCDGFQIYGYGAGIGINNINGFPYLKVRNCEITNFQHGISINRFNSTNKGHNGIYENNNIHHNTDYAIRFNALNGPGGANNSLIKNNILSYNSRGVNSASNTLGYTNLTGNTINNNQYGIFLDDFNGFYSDNNTINNNTIQAIYVGLLGHSNCFFTNNEIKYNQDGLWASGASCGVNNNDISYNINHGLFSTAGTNTGWNIFNNTINNNGGNGIYLRSISSIIINNIVNSNTGYGIYMRSTANNNNISDNHACSNTAGDIYLEATTSANYGSDIYDILTDLDSNSITQSNNCSWTPPECTLDTDCGACEYCNSGTCSMAIWPSDPKNECTDHVTECLTPRTYNQESDYCSWEFLNQCNYDSHMTNTGHVCVDAANYDVSPTADVHCGIWSNCSMGQTSAPEYYVGYDVYGACDSTDWQPAGTTWNATIGYQINVTEHADICQEEIIPGEEIIPLTPITGAGSWPEETTTITPTAQQPTTFSFANFLIGKISLKDLLLNYIKSLIAGIGIKI